MVFSSYIFLFVFLPAILAIYYAVGVGRRRGAHASFLFWRALILTLASYLFYGWERYSYLGLIVASTLVDFVCGSLAGPGRTPRVRRIALIASLVTNLGLLGFFKYRNFLIASVSAAVTRLGGEPIPLLAPELTLPVGISFYTFQSMSYTIDVYRGEVAPVPRRRIVDFFCYVSMFPQLVAGPIVRYQEIADQLVRRVHSLEKFGLGVFFFMIGFAKKTLLANNVGYLAEALFSATRPGFADAWLGMLGYAFQIYFDFSGYSDMAIGLGLMVGFVLPQNFAAPYRAASITDFWRRWHISLSTWLRDYLYVPLGGNRNGRLATYRNLLLTMLLGGLWHGAAWTFVLWGAWHGTWLALERMAGKRPLYWWAPRPLRVAFTFGIVIVGWVLFRAADLGEAGDVIAGLGGFNGWQGIVLRPNRPDWLPLTALVAAGAIVFLGRTTHELARNVTWPKIVLAWIAFVLGVQQMLQTGFNPFLYFQF